MHHPLQILLIASVTMGVLEVLRTLPQFLSYYNKPAKEPSLTPPPAETQ